MLLIWPGRNWWVFGEDRWHKLVVTLARYPRAGSNTKTVAASVHGGTPCSPQAGLSGPGKLCGTTIAAAQRSIAVDHRGRTASPNIGDGRLDGGQQTLGLGSTDDRGHPPRAWWAARQLSKLAPMAAFDADDPGSQTAISRQHFSKQPLPGF